MKSGCKIPYLHLAVLENILFLDASNSLVETSYHFRILKFWKTEAFSVT